MIKRKSVSLLFCHTSYESTAAFHSLGPNHHPIFKILIRIGDWIGPLPHSKGKVRTTQVDLIGKHLLFYISWSSGQNLRAQGNGCFPISFAGVWKPTVSPKRCLNLFQQGTRFRFQRADDSKRSISSSESCCFGLLIRVLECYLPVLQQFPRGSRSSTGRPALFL